MNNNNDTPRVWVGCLAAYNAGDLYGTWIDAHREADEIDAEIAAMLAASPVPHAEEPAIFDTDNFYGLKTAACTGKAIAQVGTFLAEHGKLGAQVVHHCGSLDEARAALLERFAGEFDSLAELAAELLCDQCEIPSVLERYIDYARYGRDLELGGDIFTIDMGGGRVAVFWTR